MAHIALYRTWRPQSFQDMVGQKHIVQTLQNSLREERFSHAYLFSGPRGTGKTSAAKILAKAVNCQNGPSVEPCNHCEACLRITEGAVMDVVEIDAASNRGVEEIRDIRDKVKYAPTEVRQKVYIIDEVHMLTTEAFNALLKTLEEPPGHVMFILATTEPHRIPATIISRCQRFDFRRVTLDEQVERLREVCASEHIEIDEDALAFIARLSDGGMRDALSLLDQIIAFSGQRVSYDDVLSITGGMASDQFEKLVSAIQDKDFGAALRLINDFMQEGKSADKCMENLIYYFRDLLMVKMVPGSQAVTERILDVKRFSEVAERFTSDNLIAMIDTLNYYQTEMKYSVQPQTLLEVSVMKLCTQVGGTSSNQGAAVGTPAVVVPERQDGLVGQLVNRIQRLEEQLSQLMKQGISPAGGGSSTGGRAGQGGGGRQTSAPSVAKKSVEKLDAYLQGREDEAFRGAVQQWSQVLGRVKEMKITVHAWLVDGEPVSIYEGQLLVAFKSAMHRETTEKPANKQLIEQAMNEVLGQPYRLVTVMMKDWNAASELAGGSDVPKEELQLVPEDEQTGGGKEAWIEEAIQLFGEDLVKIKED
ncbi:MULTISPECIES: DNA polymerase III subunit gamma/tau [unclassified Paenibacillus]|uniref:DNA polymerase III subunit gamma/tau n=1 Tax=unclassified Paenibacillus TaxID=185978 RepID=UPI001AEB8B7E|nr:MULTISPECIES: DNA polymerase III subunit gamma/tau [unclassified Paenibacillus]MBP1153450.1 DNA polymerase-3 subunit gamma/tau [Paenibacillus sp. PvP091]MBP1171167.1 DNA polymerase-3 subunit gamma/tau [Paenibacillus sp. PvR098]MBP2442195.1 DNA polymerase-3 subunit gamma/tau [Paenibacillus sp. PvP052]